MAASLSAPDFYKAFRQRIAGLPTTTVYYLRVYQSTALFKEDLPTYMDPYGFRLKTHDVKLMKWLQQYARKKLVSSTFDNELNVFRRPYTLTFLVQVIEREAAMRHRRLLPRSLLKRSLP